jgi:large subunit ribosomal protein L22
MAKTTVQENTAKLVHASARSLRISPRKMRLVTNLVKNMRVTDAVTQLQFTNKKAAKMLVRLLRSAVANAENNFSLSADNLFVKSITCDMGQTMKRMFPRARGSGFVVRRKMSHVNVVLEERAGAAPKKTKTAPALKLDKKTKPTITQEGSTGVPEETTSPVAKQPKVKEVHTENTDDTVQEKAGPENQFR